MVDQEHTPVKELELEELEDELDDSVEAIISIKSQIALKKLIAEDTNVPIDRIWLNKAVFAQGMTSSRQQQLQRELGKRNRKLRQDAAHIYAQCFVSVASELMPKLMFDSCTAIAKERSNEGS